MKDFLETLEVGDEKIKLSPEQIKEILKKHGEYIKIETDKLDSKYKEQLDENKTTINDLKEQIEKAPKTDEIKSLQDKIAEYEQKEADRTAKEKADEEDKILMDNINGVIGETKFVNDYTKNAIIDEMKNALQDKTNVGKTLKDLFDGIVKDKPDILSNPNKPKDMPGFGDIDGDDKPKNNEIKLNPMFKNYN